MPSFEDFARAARDAMTLVSEGADEETADAVEVAEGVEEIALEIMRGNTNRADTICDTRPENSPAIYRRQQRLSSSTRSKTPTRDKSGNKMPLGRRFSNSVRVCRLFVHEVLCGGRAYEMCEGSFHDESLQGGHTEARQCD